MTATAVTVPLVVLVVLLIARLTAAPAPSPSGSQVALPPVTVAAPPSSTASQGPCTKVLAQLPVQLAGLSPRVVHTTPSSPFVVAWGNPAIVLRCGVARPARLKPGSGDFLIGANGVYFLPTKTADGTRFTSVDRAVYVEVDVPSAYRQPPLGTLAAAIAKALPRVCVGQALPGEKPPPNRDLCTHRR